MTVSPTAKAAPQPRRRAQPGKAARQYPQARRPARSPMPASGSPMRQRKTPTRTWRPDSPPGPGSTPVPNRSSTAYM